MIGKHYKPADEACGGAPTKYKPEYCQRIIEFFCVDPYKKHVDENGNATDFPPKAPCIEGFADSLGVEKKTIYNWSKKHSEFLHALNLCRQKEKLFMKNAGLASVYDTRVCMSIYSSLGNDSPNIHRCKTIRNKMKSIQEALVKDEITESRAEALKNQVLSEAQITQISDLDERMKAVEKKENARNKK